MRILKRLRPTLPHLISLPPHSHAAYTPAPSFPPSPATTRHRTLRRPAAVLAHPKLSLSRTVAGAETTNLWLLPPPWDLTHPPPMAPLSWIDRVPDRTTPTTHLCRSNPTHRRFINKDTLRHWPGSALAQQLVSSLLTIIKCDDCPWQVMRGVQTTPEHSRWVFFKCKKDGVSTSFDSVVIGFSAICSSLFAQICV